MRKWVWVDERDALALHGLLTAEHGGATGIRDAGLLASALSRPHQRVAYASPNVFELAAVYTAGIVRNHPFNDGNKRTAFVVGVLFLELNGWRFGASQQDAARAVLDLAAGKADEAEYASFLRANTVKSRKAE